MIHVLVEDSSSGMEFWDLLLSNLNLQWYKVYTSHGITDMVNLVIEVLKVIDKENDLVILCVDNINGKEYDKDLSLKDNTIPAEQTKANDVLRLKKQYQDYNIISTSYYCLEELLISYIPLVDLLDRSYTEVLKVLQHLIRTSDDYFEYIARNYAKKLNAQNQKNLEKLLKASFKHVTKGTGFNFYQTEKGRPRKLGVCRFENCCSSTQGSNFKCPRYTSEMACSEKALDVFYNTILCDSVPIEVLKKFDSPSSIDTNNCQLIQKSDLIHENFYSDVDESKSEIQGF